MTMSYQWSHVLSRVLRALLIDFFLNFTPINWDVSFMFCLNSSAWCTWGHLTKASFLNCRMMVDDWWWTNAGFCHEILPPFASRFMFSYLLPHGGLFVLQWKYLFWWPLWIVCRFLVFNFSHDRFPIKAKCCYQFFLSYDAFYYIYIYIFTPQLQELSSQCKHTVSECA